MKINDDLQEELRRALGLALIKFNKQILDERSTKEKLLANKLCLRYIDILIDELGIIRDG